MDQRNKSNDEKKKLLQKKLASFQIEFEYQLSELHLNYNFLVSSKREIYKEYYDVDRATFLKWLAFFISEDFQKDFSDGAKTISREKWFEIKTALGYSNPTLRKLNCEKTILETLSDYEKVSTQERRSFKKDFIEGVPRGEEILKSSFTKFPPKVVKQFLSKKVDKIAQKELFQEIDNLNEFPLVKNGIENTVYDFPKYYHSDSKRLEYYNCMNKAFNKALAKSKLDYKEKLREVLKDLYDKKKYHQLLTLTIK